MINKVNKSIAIDPAMLAEMETRMKDEGISMAELCRRALGLYLNLNSKDSEHKPSISDMLANSDYS